MSDIFDFANMLHDSYTSTGFVIMFLTITFLFGIAIGSFLNVVILRLPSGESIIGIGRSDEEKVIGKAEYVQRPGDINGSSTQRQCGFLGGEGRVMGRGEVCRTPPDGGSVWGRHGEPW